jgi:hypothetical protein
MRVVRGVERVSYLLAFAGTFSFNVDAFFSDNQQRLAYGIRQRIISRNAHTHTHTRLKKVLTRNPVEKWWQPVVVVYF